MEQEHEHDKNETGQVPDDVQASEQMSESHGLADELFRAYEHLGILFEVTRCLPNINDEDRVVEQFIDSLQQTYGDRAVGVVSLDDAGNLDSFVFAETRIRENCTLIKEAATRCVADRGMVVTETADSQGRMHQVLAAPIYAGAELCCILVISDLPEEMPPRVLESSDVQLIEALVVFCGDLIRNLRLVTAMRQLSIDVVRAMISTIDQKDEYTAGHSSRVGFYARMLGRALQFGEEESQMLEWSALLHDVGKIGIRDDVLKKPGKLSDEEFDHIRSHPVRSMEVVRQIPQLAKAIDGVYHHHEHFDGSGYPQGLKGEEIPLQARVIQIADVFDALTTTRPYRTAFGWEKALDIIRSEAGTTVDPALAEIFDHMIRRMIEADPDAIEKIRETDGADDTLFVDESSAVAGETRG